MRYILLFLLIFVSCSAVTDNDPDQIKAELGEPTSYDEEPLDDGSIFNTAVDGRDIIIGKRAWNAIIECDGTYLAAGGDGGVAYSPDGYEWTAINAGGDNWYNAAYGGDKYIVVGNRGQMMVSSDLESWQPITCGPYWSGVAYHNGQFISAGIFSNVAYSSDTEAWTTLTVGGSWYDIVSGDGRLVLVGNDGRIAYSDNVADWTTETVGTGKWIGVAYGDGTYVTVNYETGEIAHSSDGAEWDIVSAEPDARVEWRDVAYGDGLFVAVGIAGKMASSVDGRDWEIHDVGTTDDLYSVCIRNGLTE